MTSNNRLDRTELYRITADGQREAVRLEARLQAIIDKLIGIGGEIEDEHTCQCVLHLGRRGDVKVELWKKGY